MWGRLLDLRIRGNLITKDWGKEWNIEEIGGEEGLE